MRKKSIAANYELESEKDVVRQRKYEENLAKAPKRVRLRCVNCGLFADLRNFERFHEFEELDTWYYGSKKGKRGGGILHSHKQNPELKQFWVVRLQRVLEYLGVKSKEVEVEAEIEGEIEQAYEVERYEPFVAASSFDVGGEVDVENYSVT